MDDSLEVLTTAREWLRAGGGVAVATVVATWGSSPRPVGSLMCVDEQGRFAGSISGGCIEAAVIREAQAVIRDGRCATLEFGIDDGDAWAVGLACGGTVCIFIEKIS